MKTIKNSLQIVCSLLILGSAIQANAQYNLNYFRPYDQNGVNVFETPKQEILTYDGIKVRLGGNFAQQFQGLSHSNSNPTGNDANKLVSLTNGFNLATANLNVDVALADGVRLNLITYLSSRHHQETWVKGGYIQIDKTPFLKSALLDEVMKYTTIKVGHMEVNYGDMHYRRTDNGNALYNPFVGNYILDAFTTEIGAEVIVQSPSGLLAVASATAGEIKGDIVETTSPETDDKAKRSPSYIGKIGFDKQLSEDFRLRVTGSVYTTPSSARNTLYGGDRAGSRYYLVLENTVATTNGNAFSGRFNPGYTDKVTALMGNVFMKYKGLEFFGTYENANGRDKTEIDTRSTDQLAAELLYRFGKDENLYFGGRYNTVKSELAGSKQEISIDRYQIGAGWFMTKNILLKAEYVNQDYKDFPETNILYEGNFKGVMFEAVVGF